MGLEEIFENNRKHHDNNRKTGYHENNRYPHDSHHSYQGHEDNFNWLNQLQKIKGNKKLRNLLIIMVLIILAIVIGLFFILLPQLIALANFVGENGLKGVSGLVTDFTNKLLNGSK